MKDSFTLPFIAKAYNVKLSIVQQNAKKLGFTKRGTTTYLTDDQAFDVVNLIPPKNKPKVIIIDKVYREEILVIPSILNNTEIFNLPDWPTN